MKKKVLIITVTVALLTAAIAYTVNQPSENCKASKNAANNHWKKADTANSLLSDYGLRGIYGDSKSTDAELKHSKSLYELRRVEHLYKLSASKITLDNQECFSKTEIIKARVELDTQKSFEGYFSE